MSQEWKITVSAHIPRGMEYKGNQAEAREQALKLPFDAATVLGVMFMAQSSDSSGLSLFRLPILCGWHGNPEVCSVLQIRGCKPKLQEGAKVVLETIISSTAPVDLQLNLLPHIPACNSAPLGACLD